MAAAGSLKMTENNPPYPAAAPAAGHTVPPRPQRWQWWRGWGAAGGMWRAPAVGVSRIHRRYRSAEPGWPAVDG